MSSKRKGGFGAKLPSSSATESSKGKNVNQVNDFSADQLANRVANKRLDSEQVPRNRYARKAGSQNSSAKVRGIPMHRKRKAGSQNKVEERTKELEVLKASFDAVTEKMQRVLKENNILRQRIKLHHEQIKEEMDALEEFYNEFKHIEDIRNKKEENLEKIQQEQREETKQYMETSSAEDHQSRIETGTTMILSQQKEMDIYMEERKKLLKDQEERKAELKRQQYEENVKLEEKFNAELAQLMEKYNSH